MRIRITKVAKRRRFSTLAHIRSLNSRPIKRGGLGTRHPMSFLLFTYALRKAVAW